MQDKVLILNPMGRFDLVKAELRRVSAFGGYMVVESTVRQESNDVAQDDSLRRLAVLCGELTPSALYAKYANKAKYKHEENFWSETDAVIRSHMKRVADKRIIEAVSLAHALDIPIFYGKDKTSSLRLSERLQLDGSSEVTPVMHFQRNDEGTVYQLHFRLGDMTIERPAHHGLMVLTHEPGMLVLDHHIYMLAGGFSAKLLLPFVTKDRVDIPRRIENEYFHRFILRYAARAEIHAEGFDVTDVSLQPVACLKMEQSVSGKHLLSLCFKYADTEYAPESKLKGRVTLTDDDGTFRFVRYMRDRQRETQLADDLRTLGCDRPVISFGSLSEMIEWLREAYPRLTDLGVCVVQPSDHVYHIGPLSVEQSDTWNGDWLQTNVTVVSADGRLRIPFSQLRDTILRGEQEYMLPSGERLLIPHEWLQRYADLLLTGMPRGDGFQRHRSQIVGEARERDELFTTYDARFDMLRNADDRYTVHVISQPDFSPPRSLRATLRSYQVDGIKWLWQNFAAQTGCCLADEMGLGKTLQTIALLLKYKETAKASQRVGRSRPGMLFSDEEMRGEVTSPDDAVSALVAMGADTPASAGRLPLRTSLVVAPTSVVAGWQKELARFAPSLLVMSYTGDPSRRRDMRTRPTARC